LKQLSADAADCGETRWHRGFLRIYAPRLLSGIAGRFRVVLSQLKLWQQEDEDEGEWHPDDAREKHAVDFGA
jgi:hypothetical protein